MPDSMRAISLWQPWASLWLTKFKLHETRQWSTAYRGPLLVHAARRIEFDVGPAVEGYLEYRFGCAWRATLPRGALLGVVTLEDCVPTEQLPQEHASSHDAYCGDFSAGRYAWRRAKTVFSFQNAVTYRGQQGFFLVPHDAFAVQLAEATAHA